MKVLLKSWTENLYQLFTEEVKLYRELLEIETAKTTSIIEADGKQIEAFVKKSYEIMVAASEIEKSRMKSINEIYEKASLEKAGDTPTLNEFLNQIDRDSNFRLKGVAQSLRETVQSLKEKIITNEKLLQSRKQLFQKTLQALKSESQDTLYNTDKSGKQKGNKPVMVNTHA